MAARHWRSTISRKSDLHLGYYAAKRARWIKYLGGVCVKCGATENLEFDHIDPATKSFDIGKNWSRSEKVIIAELAKCQLLCNSCHNKKSGDALAVPHGGGKCGKRGCKCTPCRLRKNEYLKLLKRERRARGLKD